VIGRPESLPGAGMASQFTVTAISASSDMKGIVEIISKERRSLKKVDYVKRQPYLKIVFSLISKVIIKAALGSSKN